MENQLAKSMDTGKQQIQSLAKEGLTQTILSSSLTIIEKEIAIASLEKKVNQYSKDELTVLMSGLILRTHANCGQKEDGENIDITIDEFVRDLKEYNKHVSFQEIELAFKNGYKGEYSEWFGLNNKTYFGWINGFTMSQNRINAKKIFKPMEIKEKIITPEEIELTIKNTCLHLFEEFKKTGKVFDIGNVNYNYLDKLSLIPFNKERKLSFMNNAIDILRFDALEKKKNAKGSFAIKEAIKQLDEASDCSGNKVKAEAKRIALNTYFNELIEMGEDLKDLIN